MNEVDRRAVLAEADLLHDLGRTEEALERLRPALEAHPDDVRALGVAALCHLAEGGDAIEALALACRAGTLMPEAELPHRLQALAYLRLNQTRRAREEADLAVALAPGSWAAHFVLGTAHLGDLRTRRRARDAARRAVDLAPSRWETHQLLARTYLDGGRRPTGPETDAALGCLDAALALAPERTELHHDLARAHLERGLTTRALAEFSDVAGRLPGQSAPLQAACACLLRVVRHGGIALSAAVLLTTVLLLWPAAGNASTTTPFAAPSTPGTPWAALVAIASAVTVVLAGSRVAVALRAGTGDIWRAAARAEPGVCLAAFCFGVAVIAQLAAVLSPAAGRNLALLAAVVALPLGWCALGARGIAPSCAGRSLRHD